MSPTNLMTPEEKYKFLFQVTNRLTKSPNHTLTVRQVTKLIVPRLADYCRIAMLDSDGKISEIAVNHKDPTKISTATELYDAYKDLPEVSMGIPKLLKTGKPELITTFNPKDFENINVSETVWKLVKNLGLRSYMGIPLVVRGKIVGAMTFSSVKEGRYYSKNDLKFALDIGRRIAFALDSAQLFKSAQEELLERVQYEEQLKFLAEASKILASSLDYKTTLTTVAKLAIEHLADWCAIDMLDRGEIKSVVIMHKDPKKVAFAKMLRKKQPPDENSVIYKVIHTKKPIFFPSISPEYIAKTVPDNKTIKIIKKIGLNALITVPIILKNESIGGITFISSSPKREYSESDLQVAQDVASRAALAIENAKLYGESQKAVHLRDDFISIASHELKTPLTSLKMHTQLLERYLNSKHDPIINKSLSKVDRQIQKLTGLITDLLDVSRIQQGKLQFREELFDLNQVVRETIESIQPTTTTHVIEVSGKIARQVYGDPERISQVLINLITNAIKYSPHAKKVLVKLATNKTSAKISVKDYGLGIDKNFQKKIFRLFYRVSTPETSTYPGLGVGLYLSNEIIKRHKGKFFVNSTPGKGAEFTFTIPFVRKFKSSEELE